MTTPWEFFARQVECLAKNGYLAITLDDYRERQETDTGRPDKEVVLTFDDGYLDNWVFAYPILERLGLRGTIYVNPEFIDPGEEPRPTLKDVWDGRIGLDRLTAHGFLNRAELRLLRESGVMTIGSHSMSHTWYEIGPEVVDFHRPGANIPWLAWNTVPERKYAYLTENQDGLVPFGTPVLRHGRSLGVRRFIPDGRTAEACVAYVSDNGGTEFFGVPDWRERLQAIVEANPVSGRLENDKEITARFIYEIEESRRILGEITGEPIRHFCWPGGAYCDQSWRIAAEAGFRTICVASRDRKMWNSEEPFLVRRIGCGLYTAVGKYRYRTTDPSYLYLACEIQRGVRSAKWPLRWKKFSLALRHGFRSSIVRNPE